ncbi:class I SAM-dependent methyltransferase [Pseudobdellovibrio exovorus]|uniref:Methyltransferase domain-containing protein n=1 Tax=Pseudobdellovibrio exovorus JSS TaxID=1184267 RepID=M4VBY4_9BACT|nr:class I SAM-dependent methyltransferase [Pseudobdellovibrio exovorus]AGH95526.1 hypothetical protein A11Q_1310 [Pseudobdellovibrio exovorus JSS]
MSEEYVLGNDQEELSRLKLQHDLWRDELLKLWDQSSLRDAKKILDLGCGPGYTSLDLLKYNRQQAQMTSIDISDNFINYLNYQLKEEKLDSRGQAKKSFIENLNLEDTDFDAAFCRWLMIFVQNPEKAFQQVYRHLTSGSEFILQEYVSYDSMDLVPDYPSMKPVVDAIFKSWKAQGGDPNRGKHLPSLLEKVGFKVTHLQPVAKFAQPQDPFWQWPDSFYRSFLPRLQKSGYLNEQQVQDFFADWQAAEKSPGSFFVAPTVINIIAKKL